MSCHEKKYFLITQNALRQNYFYFSNFTYQSKDISIQIHSFPTLLHNGCYFVNGFLSLSILNIFGFWKSPPLNSNIPLISLSNFLCLYLLFFKLMHRYSAIMILGYF